MKVLKFYASWCGPCKGLSMVIEGAKENITTEIINIDIDEDNTHAAQFKVRSVPTMILLNDSGAEIKRHIGMMNESQLLEFLKG